ncbi:hypothetical protein EON81_22930 [bacterium]|nr:MAG: hypothetical protein EON81_22930 [bacterium]
MSVNFEHGRLLTSESWMKGTSPIASLYAGMTLNQMLHDLPSDVDVRVVLPFGNRKDYLLPRDAPKLANFTGTLTSIESRMGEITCWNVRFVLGRVVDVKEETYDD